MSDSQRGNNSYTGLGLFYGNSMLMSHAQSGSHIWTCRRRTDGQRRPTYPISSPIRWAKTRLSTFYFQYLQVQKWATTWQNQQNECAPIEDSDQSGHPRMLILTGRMPRLIWVFAWRTVTLLVLSCRGSNLCWWSIMRAKMFIELFGLKKGKK